MQSALALGLAKNVNTARQPGARRAASAYNLTGRHLSPSSSSSSLSSLSSGDASAPASAGVTSDAQESGVPSLLALSAVSTSPLSSSSSCSSISSMVNGDFKGLGLGDHLGNPQPGNLVAQSRGLEADNHHLAHRGSGVDKTNPFIGYFKMASQASAVSSAGPGSPASSTGAVPSVATVRDGVLGSFQYSTVALYNQQKKISDWLGSRTTRLPSFFGRRDEKPPLASTKKIVKKIVNVEEVETVETAPVALFADYSMAGKDGLAAEEQEDGSSTTGKGVRELVKEEQQSAALGCRRRASSSSSTVSTTTTSRFVQDFEVVGVLGEGGQGTVFKVRSKVDGFAYAIKKVVLPRSLQRDSIAFHQALREVKAMAAMGTHANVVRYHTAWLEEDEVESTAGNGEPNAIADSKASSSSVNSIGKGESSVAFSYFSENSYSISSLSQFDTSMDGVHFEFSRSIVADTEAELLKSMSRRPLEGVQEDAREDDSVSSQGDSQPPETQLVLYIQMELCGSAAVTLDTCENEVDQDESDSFQRLINRVTMKSQKKPVNKELGGDLVHSTLSSWLRATVEARSSPDENFTKHREGLKILLGVVQGVQHMHEAGVIHRDLKPDNVFIHGDVPKIGDFGLSKSIVSDAQDVVSRKGPAVVSSAGEDHTTALGTFTYASPEQLGYSWNRSKGSVSQLAKSAKYSIKSDIFALGIILLELCYPCSTMMERSQVLTAVRHGVVPQIALQRFPDEMALVLRMTSLDPEERPTTEEIAEQLRALLATKESVNARAALDDLRDLQQKLALAVLQLRDRSQAAQQLELLVAELSDKVHNVGLAIA